jgi:acetyl esterase/lipase
MVTDTGRVTIEEGVVFGAGGGRELRCDIFTPPGSPRSAPGVLLLHGGGWRSGDRSQLRGYGVLLGREGYVCVASEYRLAPDHRWPAHLHDVKAALRWMRANAGRLGIDPERIAVSGNSAGAHLALMLAATPGAPEFEGDGGNPGVRTDVAAAIAIYPPTDLTHLVGADPQSDDAVRTFLGPAATTETARRASPLAYARADFPPTLLIHGTADTVVNYRESLRMFEALEAAGAPVELHLYAGQPHAFDAAAAFGRQCAQIMRLFLDRHVPAPVAAG